jgi:hypothetical protein
MLFDYKSKSGDVSLITIKRAASGSGRPSLETIKFEVGDCEKRARLIRSQYSANF